MALPSSYGIEKNMNSLEGLKAYENGGKGSGNWGHAGRPGEVGGSAPAGSTSASLGAPESSSQSTIGKRFARKARVAELLAKYRELDRWHAGMTDEEEAAADKAEEEYRLALAEDEVKSGLEVKRGKEKKRRQDTPGKQETLDAKKEWENALEVEQKAGKKLQEAEAKDSKTGHSYFNPSEETKKLKEKRDKAREKTLKMTAKLNQKLVAQAIQDKTFKSEMTRAIEAGLGIKLETPLEMRDVDRSRRKDEFRDISISAKLPKGDLGVFGGVLSKAELQGNMQYHDDEMMNSSARQPRMSGYVSLQYESNSGGRNGQNVVDVWYYPDGTFDISDRRGNW